MKQRKNFIKKKEIADKIALDEYKKYRIIQDREYISDFDELLKETKKLKGGQEG